jgi:hypothetical protein
LPATAENSHRQGPEVCPSRQARDFEAVAGLTNVASLTIHPRRRQMSNACSRSRSELRSDSDLLFDIVRERGLAFPRAKETRYYGLPALEVDGEVFVVQTTHRSADPNSISVAVGFETREKLIANNSRVFYLKPHYQNYPVVLVRLDQIDRGRLNEVLHSAYAAVVSGKVKIGRSRVARRRPTSPKKRIRRRRARTRRAYGG